MKLGQSVCRGQGRGREHGYHGHAVAVIPLTSPGEAARVGPAGCLSPSLSHTHTHTALANWLLIILDITGHQNNPKR